MKKAVNLLYEKDNFNGLFLRANKLYKEAKSNNQAKFGLIRETVKSDQGMLQFVFLTKKEVYKKVRGTCLEYVNNEKVFASRG